MEFKKQQVQLNLKQELFLMKKIIRLIMLAYKKDNKDGKDRSRELRGFLNGDKICAFSHGFVYFFRIILP
ncbi:hypothetical protein K4889_000901 [Campylobacter coli]|nr:hypothetical protein [Campylobacter coli]